MPRGLHGAVLSLRRHARVSPRRPARHARATAQARDHLLHTPKTTARLPARAIATHDDALSAAEAMAYMMIPHEEKRGIEIKIKM